MIEQKLAPTKGKEIAFEDRLWKAAGKLRKKVEVHVFGLIFSRYK